jgi:hypothetical protein
MLRKSHESASRDVKIPPFICKRSSFCDHGISIILWLGFLNLILSPVLKIVYVPYLKCNQLLKFVHKHLYYRFYKPFIEGYKIE